MMRKETIRARSVVLVALDWLRAKDPPRSLGHTSLLASLCAADGIEAVSVTRAVNSPGFDPRELLDALLVEVRRGATVIAFGVYVWNDAVVRQVTRGLRAAGFNGRVILGGPQLSYAEAGVGDGYPEADVIIRGYAEQALVAVVRAERPTAIPGVSWRGQVDLGRPADIDLSTLPSPILTGLVPVHPFTRWETQRGCVYACSFCQHRQAGARLKRRNIGVTRVADEIDALVEGGARDIAVLDPIFHSNPDAVAILRRFAARGYTGQLSLQSRFELLDDAFVDACTALDVTLEFGLQTVHASEMQAACRANHLPRVERAIEVLHRRGVEFEVSLIYGLPTQTLASFEATVRWCRERGVSTLKAFPLMLLRGTGMHRRRAEWGLVENDDIIPLVVESDSFSQEDWGRMRALAVRLGDATVGTTPESSAVAAPARPRAPGHAPERPSSRAARATAPV